MNIMLIDDDPGVLAVTKVLLKGLGHTVVSFRDPRQAVGVLTENHVDLVISDVRMPVLDGFEVARLVAEAFGTSPPRVLLVSGGDDAGQKLQTTPPSVVIGLLPKPVDRDDLGEVLSLLEQSRACCPGTVAPFCPHVQKRSAGRVGVSAPGLPCHASDYTACPHYAGDCGTPLRHWIRDTTVGTGQDVIDRRQQDDHGGDHPPAFALRAGRA